MQDQRRHWRQCWKWVFLFVLMMAIGCGGSGGSGCSCAKPIPGGFPKQYKSKNITQIKLTQKAFGFIEQNANAIIAKLLPTGLEFNVPQSKSGRIEVCVNGNCKIKLNVRRLKFTMKPTKKLGVNVWMDILSTNISVRAKFGPIKAKCNVKVDSKNKSIGLDAALGIDSRNQGLSVALGQPSVSISRRDFKITGGVGCGIIDLLKGLFKGLLEREVKKALGKIIGEITCMKCKSSSDCPSGATCSSGVCSSGGKCYPMEVGFSGAVDFKSLLSGLGNPTAHDLLFGINLGGRAEVKSNGLELGMLGGTHSQPHPCVKPQKFSPLPASPLFPFPASAPDGKTYMLGAAISQVMMTQAARSIYQNGGLCIRIDSSVNEDLGGALSVKNLGGLISPSLPKLVGGGDAPMVIALRPSEPPDISIGKGTIGKDAKGNPTVKDPLVDLKIPNLYFDFLILLHDRWTRVFSYKVDVALPIGLAVKPGNKIGLVLGDLGSAMSNPRIENSFMVKEDPKKLANGLFNLLKAILPLATGSLGNQEFDLPDLQGMRLTVRGITGQQPRSGRPGRFNFLTLFADLGLAPATKPLLPDTTIGLRFVRMEYPKGLQAQIKQRVRLTQWPSAVVEVDDFRPDREYSFRLNSAMWSPYTSKRHFVLESPQFLMQGRHTLYVRSRLKDRPGAPDMGRGVVRFVVDYTSPRMDFKHIGHALIPSVYDNVTRTEHVKVEYRLPNEGWIALAPGAEIPTDQIPKNARVEIRATDAKGNVQRMFWTHAQKKANISKRPAPVVQQPAAQSKVNGTQKAVLGCNAWPVHEPESPVLFLLILGGLFFLRRAHRRS